MYVAYCQSAAVFIKHYTQHKPGVGRWSREWEDLGITGANNRAQLVLLTHVAVALNDNISNVSLLMFSCECS